MLKNLLTLFVLSAITFSCLPEDDTMNPTGNLCDFDFVDIVFEAGGGYYNTDSWRNHRYQIETNQDNAVISVSAFYAGIKGRVYILNSAGTELANNLGDVTEAIIEDFTLGPAGTYYIVVTTEVDASGTYTLSLCGEQISSAVRISSKKEAFTAQSWTDGGGLYEPNAYRNAQYSFQLQEGEEYIDIVCKSNGPNLRVYILNSARDEYANNQGDVVDAQMTIKLAQPGTYYIVVCTDPFTTSTFDLALYSKSGAVSNFVPVPSSQSCQSSGWNGGGGLYDPLASNNRRFDFTVYEPNTYIDISAISNGANNRVYLLNSANGEEINSDSYGLTSEIRAFKIAQPGDYTIAVNAAEFDAGSFEVCLTAKEGTVSELVPE